MISSHLPGKIEFGRTESWIDISILIYILNYIKNKKVYVMLSTTIERPDDYLIKPAEVLHQGIPEKANKGIKNERNRFLS